MNLARQKMAAIGPAEVAPSLDVEFGKCCEVPGFDINAVRKAELQAGQQGSA